MLLCFVGGLGNESDESSSGGISESEACADDGTEPAAFECAVETVVLVFGPERVSATSWHALDDEKPFFISCFFTSGDGKPSCRNARA